MGIRNSLTLPDFHGVGLKLARRLGGTFRGLLILWPDVYGLGNSLAAPSLLRGVRRLFHDAALLKDIGEEGSLAQIVSSALTELFPALR